MWSGSYRCIWHLRSCAQMNNLILPCPDRRRKTTKFESSKGELMDFALKECLVVTPFLFLPMACSEPPGEEVLVPGDQFSVSLEIAVQTEAIAGEAFLVSAKRRSGPWKRVKRSEVRTGVMAFPTKPPELEPQVAENVFWETEPTRSARFGTLSGCCWLPRTATFAAPGTYKIWAFTVPVWRRASL